MHLCYTFCIRNEWILSLHVHQHFGTVTNDKEMSVKAKWLRKKYTGVWRRVSSLMSRMRRRFPSTMVRYMPRNRAKNTP